MNALLDPSKFGEIVGGCLGLLEVRIALLMTEAGDFLEHVEQLEREGFGLAAHRPAKETTCFLDPMPFKVARNVAKSGADLALYTYAWALRHLARGETIVAVDWRRGTCGPVDLRGFSVARQIRGIG